MIIGKKIEPQLISVIIPTLNEEANIVKTILRVKKLFNEIKTKYEIIIVDEKSTDNTIKNIHKQNKLYRLHRLYKRYRPLYLHNLYNLYRLFTL